MFAQHNTLTKASYWLLGVNSIIVFVVLGMVIQQAIIDQQSIINSTTIFAGIIAILNTYIALRIYGRSKLALKTSLLFYAIQCIGIQSRWLTLNICIGLDIFLNIKLGATVLTINFVPLFILIVILFAFRSIKKETVTDSG